MKNHVLDHIASNKDLYNICSNDDFLKRFTEKLDASYQGKEFAGATERCLVVVRANLDKENTVVYESVKFPSKFYLCGERNLLIDLVSSDRAVVEDLTLTPVMLNGLTYLLSSVVQATRNPAKLALRKLYDNLTTYNSEFFEAPDISEVLIYTEREWPQLLSLLYTIGKRVEEGMSHDNWSVSYTVPEELHIRLYGISFGVSVKRNSNFDYRIESVKFKDKLFQDNYLFENYNALNKTLMPVHGHGLDHLRLHQIVKTSIGSILEDGPQFNLKLKVLHGIKRDAKDPELKSNIHKFKNRDMQYFLVVGEDIIVLIDLLINEYISTCVNIQSLDRTLSKKGKQNLVTILNDTLLEEVGIRQCDNNGIFEFPSVDLTYQLDTNDGIMLEQAIAITKLNHLTEGEFKLALYSTNTHGYKKHDLYISVNGNKIQSCLITPYF